VKKIKAKTAFCILICIKSWKQWKIFLWCINSYCRF